jgi:predicted short-subunit dehydrogenase-like oxidoreductase (DUF2520 family)
VTDTAIADMVSDLKLPGKVVAHTAASVSKDVLKKVTPHHGVFYPLQSLGKKMNELPDIPVFIDASDELTKKTLEKLGASISSTEIVSASDDQRIKMHVAAVMVNNFVNHLYALIEDYCRKEGLDFKQLVPLIEETAKRLEKASAKEMQTGPAIRGDQATIEKHLEILDRHPRLRNLYEVMTASIRQS